jgi:DNA-binding NarL/FixJ family response regulator
MALISCEDNMIKKIMIMDKNPLVRIGLKELLQEHHYRVVGETDDIEGMLRTIYFNQPDLLIMDNTFQSENVLSMVETLKKAFVNLSIMMLSVSESYYHITHCSDIGVDGYLCKTASTEEILKGIKLIEKNKRYFPGSLLKHKVKYPEDAELLAQLSERELYILRQFNREKNNQRIASEMNITNKIVSAYKIRIMQKMKVFRSAEMIEIARRNYIF